MAAFTKNDMKPSLMPCCLTNRSWWRSRSASTLDMSISLKVVRIAAVCWASTSRRATVLRSGDMATTRSRALSTTGACGRRGPKGRRRLDRLRRRPRGSGPGLLLERARHVLLRDPPAAAAPLDLLGGKAAVGQRAASRRRSPHGLRRRGRPLPGLPLPAVASRIGRLGLALAGAPAPSCSISAMTSPTATTSPALRRILRRTPAPGEGTSTVAFSLSTSTSGSSADLVALGVLPGAERGLANRFTQRRDPTSSSRHQIAPFRTLPSTSHVCSRVWRLAEPVAGLAESGRVTPDQGNVPARSGGSSRLM